MHHLHRATAPQPTTFSYADRAKQIKNKAAVNENPTDKLIRELREENEKIKKLMEAAAGGMSIEEMMAVSFSRPCPAPSQLPLGSSCFPFDPGRAALMFAVWLHWPLRSVLDVRASIRWVAAVVVTALRCRKKRRQRCGNRSRPTCARSWPTPTSK